MTAPLGRIALAALSLAFAEDAGAREIRNPERGNPAFVAEIPDNWKDEIDPDHNMVVSSADESASFVFTRGGFSGPLEGAAKMILRIGGATPPVNGRATTVSGLSGFIYDSTIKVGNEPPIVLKMTIVRVRESGFMSCTQMWRANATARQRQIADKVMQSVKIIGAGNPQ